MLHVDKVDSLQSEKVHITADGLEESQCYKIRLVMHHERGAHASFCIIRSNEYGIIDLATDKPLRGTYYDVDQMGLFLSLTPTESVPRGYLLRDVSKTPYYYTLQLFNDVDEIKDTVALRKHMLHPSVSRIQVEQDGLYGVLFKPPGPGPFPCIIDIPGTVGTYIEKFAAMYASEGFLTFTFAYYGHHPNLPEDIIDVDVEYFEKPIAFVKSLPYCSGRIGVHGLSFGGTVSGCLAVKYSQISAVIAMNGSESFFKDVLILKENGEPMRSDYVDEGMSVFVNGVLSGIPAFQEHFRRLTAENRIQWEEAPKETAFRIVAGTDDGTMCSAETAMNIYGYLMEAGRNVEIDLVPGGHFLYPPYIPHHSIIYHKGLTFYWNLGGECVLHSKSQETVWRKNVEFFKRHLECPPRIPNWQREQIVEIPKMVASKFNPSVFRIQVEQGGLYGVLFKPPGPGQFSYSIDVPEAAGTYHENYGVGFGRLFDMHLPKSINDADIDVDTVFRRRIGLHGFSFGGTAASYLPIKYSGISAVVSINGSESFVKGVSAMKEHGVPIRSDTVDNDLNVFVNGTLRGAPAYLDHYKRVTPETRIPWEKAPKEIAFRLVASLDNGTMSALRTAKNIHKYLITSGRTVEIDLVPGGHLLSSGINKGSVFSIQSHRRRCGGRTWSSSREISTEGFRLAEGGDGG